MTMHAFLEDLAYSLRMLLRRPGFALITIIALALGIGAVAAQFSLLNAFLWKQPPFADPARLVQLDLEHKNEGWRSSINWELFTTLRGQLRSFDAVGGYSQEELDVKDGDLWRTFNAAFVTVNMFGLLDVRPALGRFFTADDARPDAEGAAVIGYDRWRSDYAGSPDVIGRILRVRNRDWHIVGVAPEGFDFFENRGLWLPIMEGDLKANDMLLVHGVGRLRSGVAPDQARAELAMVFGRITGEAKFTGLGRFMIEMRPLREFLDPRSIAVLWILLLMAVGVLGVACFNVSNLLLARGLDRQHELAIRGAMGASRWRLARQMLTECLLLATVGACGGVVLSLWMADYLQGFMHRINLPAWASMRPDARSLAFIVVTTVGAALVCGLIPARRASRLQLAALINQGARTGAGPHMGWVIRTLVIAQIAVAIALLSISVMTQQWMAGWRAEHWAGHPDQVFGGLLNLESDRYANKTTLAAFQSEALRDLGALPGVQAVGLTTRTASGAHPVNLQLAGLSEMPQAWQESVSPGYFDCVEARLLQGRLINDKDVAGAERVTVVNQAFVDRFLHGQNPLGCTFVIQDGGRDTPATVVGVVENLHMRPVHSQGSEAGLYTPLAQTPDMWTFVMVRGDPRNRAALLGQTREAILRRDPEAKLGSFRSIAEQIAEGQVGPRIIFSLINLFAAIGLFLATLGVAGMTSFSLARRSRELAIRSAIGAVRGDLVRIIVRREILQFGLGLAFGFVLSLGLLKLMQQGSGLFTLKLSYCLVGSAVMLLGILLAMLPALCRVLRMHPMDLLREE